MPNNERPRRKTPVDHDPQALREARIRAGLRQRELADQLGVTQSVISEAETGSRGISPAVRLQAAKLLGCDPITFAPLKATA